MLSFFVCAAQKGHTEEKSAGTSSRSSWGASPMAPHPQAPPNAQRLETESKAARKVMPSNPLLKILEDGGTTNKYVYMYAYTYVFVHVNMFTYICICVFVYI